MRAKINRGTLTTESEGSVNKMLGQIHSIDFFNGMYKKSSKIICNPGQTFQEIMVGMNRQALNLQLSKQKKDGCKARLHFLQNQRRLPSLTRIPYPLLFRMFIYTKILDRNK